MAVNYHVTQQGKNSKYCTPVESPFAGKAASPGFSEVLSSPNLTVMADYWKSNPRKFCEVCKCWLADNKPSIDFHEGGRRHQANVQKQLQQARARSAENAKEKLNIEKTLSAIEHAAFSAYQQDLAGGHVKKAKVPVLPVVEQAHKVQEFLAEEQQKVERELEKKTIEAKAHQKIQEIQTKALEQAYQSYSASYLSAPQGMQPMSAPQGIPTWQQFFSPEGHVYYYNNITGVTQWEVPENFQVAVQPVSTPTPVTTTPQQTSAASPAISTANSATVEEKSLKRAADQAEVEERDVYQPPKRKGAYGAWTTVAVIDRDVKEERQEPQDVGTEADGKEGDTTEGDTQEEIQFEEKKFSGELGEEFGEFKGFAFKKRTNKARPQIRQRIGDV